ncbi:DUF4307 domain-containing protein [Microbacterium sp.]|uniref:DUF4307 domain-containing protein n=1 Tax=Microbacterium sp. TaxID=51671 RepID=UPI003A8C3BAD
MSTTQTTAERLDDRYGRRRSGIRQRLWWVLVGVVAVALLGFVSWSTVSTALRAVDVDTLGFETVDEHTVTVDFQITTTPGTAVACAIEAQDEEHGIVGWRVIEYPGRDTASARYIETIPTTAQATTGLATSCWML